MPSLKITKQTVNVLGKPPQKPVVPIALPDPVANLLLHNWVNGFVLERTFDTDVQRSPSTLAEERTALLAKPGLIAEIHNTGKNQNISAQAMMNVLAHCSKELPFPLFCDQSKITATSSGVNVYCDTAYRRLFKGGRVVVFTLGVNGPSNAEYKSISSVVDGQIILTTALSGTFNPATGVHVVIPLIDAHIELSGKVTALTGKVGDVLLSAEQLQGQAVLPPDRL